MSRTWKMINFLLILMTAAGTALAQSDDSGAGCAGCAACGGTIFVVIVGIIALNVFMLVWVAKDAKSRGMDTPILWMLLVFFLGVFGLLIYIFSRPQGTLVKCAHCGNTRLEASAQCPHCGNP